MDLIFFCFPVILVISVLSWIGAHSVSGILMLIVTVMTPVMFFLVYSERFDEYWNKREAEKPAEV